MSEGTTEGTAFFSVENNFSKTDDDFRALEAAVERSLGAIRSQFSAFAGVDFNPLDKVYDKVNQQAGLIERRLQELFRKYDQMARQGKTPELSFAVAAQQVVTRGAEQVDKTIVSQAPKLGDADLADMRRTLVQALVEGATQGARILQSQVRATAREAGGNVEALAGSANTLRTTTVARPVLHDVPDSQSAADFVAATRAATRARQDAARASTDAAAADRQAAKASTDAAAKPKAPPTAQAAPVAASEPAPKPPVAPTVPERTTSTQGADTSAAELAAANQQAARAALDAAAETNRETTRAAAAEAADAQATVSLQSARTELATALRGALRRAQELGATTLPVAPPAGRPVAPQVVSDSGLTDAQTQATAATQQAARSARAAADANELARRASLDVAKADADSAVAARDRANALRSAARVASLTAAADLRAAQDAQGRVRDLQGPGRPAAPPAPPTPPTPPTPPRGGGGGNQPPEDGENAGRRVAQSFLDGLRQRLREGTARFVNGGDAIFDPSGPFNRNGQAPFVSARSQTPIENPIQIDRLLAQVDAELGPVNRRVAELEARITHGDLVALNSRIATQPLDQPDEQRTFISRQTAEPVNVTGGQKAIDDATVALEKARRDQTAAAEAEARQARLLAEVEAGTAQFLDSTRRVAIRSTAPFGQDIVNGRTGEPLPQDEADRLRRQFQDQINQVRRTQTGVDNGSLLALNSRLATQAPGTVSDADRTIISRATGQVVDNLQQTSEGARLYATALRQAAIDTRQAAERALIEQRINSGDLLALNSRLAVRPPTQPEIRTVAAGEAPPLDSRRSEIFDRTTGQVVTDEAEVQKALGLLADVYRKAAGSDLSALIRENEQRVVRELLGLAEDLAAKRRAGRGPDTDTGVQFGTNRSTLIDSRNGGTPSVFQVGASGVQQIEPDRAAQQVRATADRVEAAEAARTAQVEREQQAAMRERVAAERQVSRTGVANNFLQGVTSGGFGGNGESGLDGLARAAGQTAKYSTLYSALNLLRQGLAATVSGFLDADDSITEWEIATSKAGSATADFTTTLQGSAETTGFNVGEALDVASKAVRAFGGDIDKTSTEGQQAMRQLGEGFTEEASKLALLAKTNLTDASGNLTAIASGFDLPKNQAGFSQVTDAIAGAKLAGGGDETQIFQGLANAAVTLKNLGFSLNESATILSKLNAQTDQSGQLIATRISRAAASLSGGQANKFIQSLNQQLPQSQQVDVAASGRDQLLQLAGAYQKMNDAQKAAAVSALGGSSEERELSLLLKELPQISAEAAKIKPGAGLKEFEDRLNNVRAILTEIQGYIQTIIVNITTSGLTAPFIELVKVLQLVFQAASNVSKAFKLVDDALSINFGGINFGLTSVISNLGALLLAIKGLQAVKNAGGIRGLLGSAEEVVAPGRTLARQQLAGTTGTTPSAATTTGGALTPVAGVQGRADAAAERADRAINFPSGVAADRNVREAGERVLAASERLAAAEDAEAAVIRRQADERANLRTNLGSNAKMGALLARQEQELADAAQGGITAQLDLTASEALLAQALRLQAAQAEVAASFEARRAALLADFQQGIGKVAAGADRSFQAGGTQGLDRARAREVELREEFNAKLNALAAERQAAEQRATAAASLGKVGRVTDTVTIGGASAFAAARAEGAGVFRAGVTGAASSLSNVMRTVSTGIFDAFKAVGIPGLAFAAVDLGVQVLNASNQIQDAERNLAQINSQIRNQTPSVDNFKQAAADEGSAGSTLRQAVTGPVASNVDALLNSGRGAQMASQAELLTDAFKRAADGLTQDESRLKATQSPKAAAASTLDFSDPTKLKNAFDALQSQGYTASQSMDLLITRIRQLNFTSRSTADHLNDDQKGALAQAAGVAAVGAIPTLPKPQKPQQQVVAGTGVGAVPITVDSNVVNQEQIQARAVEVVKAQLARGSDVSTATGQKDLEDALVKGYANLVPDAGQARAIAHAVAQSVLAQAQSFAKEVNTTANLQDLVAQGIAGAQAAAQEAQRNAQLKALQTGTRDTSQRVGAQTNLTMLQQTQAAAQAKITELRAANQTPTQDDTDRLRQLEDAITQAKIQQAQALIADAQAQLADNKLMRQAQQRKAKSSAQIAAIGKSFFNKDIQIALKTGDIQTILAVFNDASQVEIRMVLASLEDAKKAAAAKLAADQAANAAAQAALQQVNAMGGDVAGGALDAVHAANAGAAKAALAADQARSAAADRALSAAKAAAKQSSAPAKQSDSNYIGGKDALGGGGAAAATPEQVAASLAQARAVRDRNSTEVARAAVQAARADLGAAKDQSSRAQALQQLYAAENTLADTLKGVAVSRKYANINPNDSVANARKALDEARVELTKFGSGTAEYFQALAQFRAAQVQLSADLRNLAVAKRFANLNPNDSLGNARKALAQANSDIRQYAKGSPEYYQALEQIHGARIQLAADQRNLSVTKKYVNAFPASEVQTAAKGIDQARADLKQYTRGSLEYYQALAALVQAQRDLRDAQNTAYFNKVKLATDLTDPVAQARIAVREAAAKLAILKREGAPKDVVTQAQLDLRNAQSQSESAAFSQRLQDAQTNEELGRISHTAYLRYLENEHNRLVTIRHRTRQQQDELNQIDQAIKAANDQFQGQFNIGDVKVPTIYEVRRAVANQTGKESVVANSQVNNTTHNNVTVNGADFARVVDYLKSIIGPQGASRITPIPRKG